MDNTVQTASARNTVKVYVDCSMIKVGNRFLHLSESFTDVRYNDNTLRFTLRSQRSQTLLSKQVNRLGGNIDDMRGVVTIPIPEGYIWGGAYELQHTMYHNNEGAREGPRDGLVHVLVEQQ